MKIDIFSQLVRYCLIHTLIIYILCLFRIHSNYQIGADRLSLFDLQHTRDKNKCLLNESKWANGKGKVHKYGVSSIKWYPIDNGMFISGSLDGTVMVWDTNLFDQVLKFNIKQKVFNISINF